MFRLPFNSIETSLIVGRHTEILCRVRESGSFTDKVIDVRDLISAAGEPMLKTYGEINHANDIERRYVHITAVTEQHIEKPEMFTVWQPSLRAPAATLHGHMRVWMVDGLVTLHDLMHGKQRRQADVRVAVIDEDLDGQVNDDLQMKTVKIEHDLDPGYVVTVAAGRPSYLDSMPYFAVSHGIIVHK